jgi:hypothetical protein
MSTHAFQSYALPVQSRFVNTVSAGLCGKGCEEFLAVYCSRRRWSSSSRFEEIELPMFSGYSFCRFNPQDPVIPTFTTPGVMGIPVSEDEIEMVRAVLPSGLTAHPWP